MKTQVLDLIHELGNCQAACNNYFNTFLYEKNIHVIKDCIKLDKKCAEICGLNISSVTSNSFIKKEVLKLCTIICKKCVGEWKKFHYDHCQECAWICEGSGQACKNYA
ncbi:MAG: hypothetical protein LUG18_10315 [Candidatus Azobacteroides sp.]|nr:hypothetical protein [Candidatus Azobacteroides sp.]